MKINTLIPAFSWLRSYRRADIKHDLAAGLTVGVMLIPQGMAYAMIAGLPPIYGLYASTIPLIVYALLGSSRQLAVGPVAMVSLLTAAGVGALAEGGTETYIQMAILLAFMVGAIQFLLGVFRLGFLVNFLSHPVISGFTSAAALIIGLSQLKHLMGVTIPRSHHVHEILWHAMEKIGETNLPTLLIGVGGVAIIMIAKRINKAIPSQLLAVVFGILVVWLLGLTDQGVKIVGEIPSGLPAFALPHVDVANLQLLIPTALAIALVSFMESIAVAKAIQSKHRNYKVEADQELRALGLANIFGSMFQAYPTTGGFSRTAVNDQAGARTGMASILSALLIVLTLLFLTPLFYYMPQAILASVIMVAVFGLIDFHEAQHLWRSNRSDFWMLVVTFVATLGLGIEQGIGVGVILSLAMVIFRTTRPHIAELGKVPGTHFYRNVTRFKQLEIREDLLIVRFDAQLYFANVNFFKDTIEQLLDSRKHMPESILVDAESINNIDSSAIHMLEELLVELRERKIRLYFSGVKGPVRDALARAGFTQEIGEAHFFMSIQEAVDQLDAEASGKVDLEKYTLQSNI